MAYRTPITHPITLTRLELAVLDCVRYITGNGGTATIGAINVLAWSAKGGPTTADITSWTRNSLRRPVRAGLIAFHGRRKGYSLTAAGFAALNAAKANA